MINNMIKLLREQRERLQDFKLKFYSKHLLIIELH